MADNHMVQEIDIQYLRGLSEPPCNLYIGCAGRWISAGMIVKHDDRR